MMDDRRRTMHRRQALKMFAGLVLCPLCAPASYAAEHQPWGYTGEAGPDKWGGLDAADAACSAGGQQSPIDITGTINARQPPRKISWSKRPDTIVNNGHTIPIEVDEADIVRFGKLYPMNARPVQKRDRRFILSSSPR